MRRRLKNYIIEEKYKKTRKIVFVVLFALELLWSIVLFFMEKDYISGIQIILEFFGGALAIFYGDRLKPLLEMILCVVIIIVLFIINLRWSLGIKRQNLETVNTVMREETKNEENNNVEVKEVEKNLKSLVLQNDYLLKLLTEYTNEQGSDDDKIKAVFENEIDEWMEEWNTLNLGEFGSDFLDRRNWIDDFYSIRCVGEMNSEYIQDLAIDDLKWCIEEIDRLHYDYTNPELLKEEAGKYIELGGLCENLERHSEASIFYYKAVDVAWEGVEESIQYGMSTNAKETLETMGTAYKKMNTLPDPVFDDWDRERALTIGNVLQDLSDSFDIRFPHE